MRYYLAFPQWALLLGLVICSGCGGGSIGPKLHSISGNVTVDDKPLDDGYITFMPTESGKPAAAAPIKNGAYTVKTVSGPKKVEIIASRRLEGKKDAMGMPMTEQYIPKNYNVQTELKADVSDKANSTADFKLKIGAPTAK